MARAPAVRKSSGRQWATPNAPPRSSPRCRTSSGCRGFDRDSFLSPARCLPGSFLPVPDLLVALSTVFNYILARPATTGPGPPAGRRERATLFYIPICGLSATEDGQS